MARCGLKKGSLRNWPLDCRDCCCASLASSWRSSEQQAEALGQMRPGPDDMYQDLTLSTVGLFRAVGGWWWALFWALDVA